MREVQCLLLDWRATYFIIHYFIILPRISLGTRFHITKYPTLKYMRNGIVAKREYRGQRTVDAFTEFVRQQTEEVVKEYSDLNDLKDMDVSGQKFTLLLLGKTT